MEYSKNQDENNNEDFKKFLVKGIIWTVVLTVAGIFLFPFLGWVINNMRTVLIVLIVMCSISGVLLLTWLVPFIVRFASKKTSAHNIKLLVFALSLGCIAGVNLGLFDDKFWGDHIDGRRTLYRWGNCMVSYDDCFTMFGKKLTYPNRSYYGRGDAYYRVNEACYRVYNDDWEKVIAIVSSVYEVEESDNSDYWGKKEDCTITGIIYDTKFNYLGELDTFKRSIYRNSEGRYEYNGSDNYECDFELWRFYPIHDVGLLDWCTMDNSYSIALLVDFLNGENYTLAEDYGVNVGKNTIVSKKERQKATQHQQYNKEPVFIKKELISPKHKYRNQTQWYKYYYLSGNNDTLVVAYDINNNKRTPYAKDVYYAGGDMFGTTNYKRCKKMMNSLYDLNGTSALYDSNGKCVFPDDMGYVSYHYDPDANGIVIATARERDSNRHPIYAAIDMDGNVIISESLGYTWIAYYEKYGCFWCSKDDEEFNDIESSEISYSRDGKYYAKGYCDKEEFNAKKRPITSMGKDSPEPGLLYECDYTEGSWINPNTGYSQPAPNPHHHIKIYEDHIVIDMLNLSCSGKSSSGEKMFINSWSNITYYVDNFFNIRSTFPYGYSRFTKGNVVYDMNAPVQNYDDGGCNGGTKGTNGDYKGGQTRPSTKDCPVCHTTRNCQTCLGRGWVTGLDNQRHDCPTCHGNKVCWKCNGSGKVSTY